MGQFQHVGNIRIDDDVFLGDSAGPLALAARKGDLDETLRLLGKGSEVNESDAVGETPIFEAVVSGHLDVVAALLLHSADPCHRSMAGASPAEFAANNSVRELLRIFEDTELEGDAVKSTVCSIEDEKLRESLGLLLWRRRARHFGEFVQQRTLGPASTKTSIHLALPSTHSSVAYSAGVQTNRTRGRNYVGDVCAYHARPVAGRSPGGKKVPCPLGAESANKSNGPGVKCFAEG